MTERGMFEMLEQRERAERCTCGMAEQERTGHCPEHAEWCDVADEDDGPDRSGDVWDDRVAPGGFVCGLCGMPTESEPCSEHLADPWRAE